LRISRAEVSAQLVALNAEANEVKRFEAEQDRLRDEASRAEELRESRRADPATSLVAHWLGTTEARLNLLQDFVCVVVLEGTACFAWYFAGLGAVVLGRKAVGYDRNTTELQQEAVASIPEAMSVSRVEQSATHFALVAEQDPFKNDAPPSAMSDDDRMVAEIHEAVVAGRLKRNLVSIREFVGCAQARAVRLNRL
jgi:hypothetical protein